MPVHQVLRLYATGTFGRVITTFSFFCCSFSQNINLFKSTFETIRQIFVHQHLHELHLLNNELPITIFAYLLTLISING